MASPVLPDTLLEVRNLSTWFDTGFGVVKAVEEASFTLKRGKTLCVVGESGSGKSVTARSILQIVPRPGRIVAGQILLHGSDLAAPLQDVVDIAKLSPRWRAVRSIRGRDISMIFQEPMSSLSPVHTIGQQITEAIRHVQMLREGLGPDIDIAVDFHAKTSPSVAAVIIKELEPLHLLWVEEPCPPENVKAMARIARPWTVEQVTTVDGSLASLDAAAVKKDWGEMETQAESAWTAMSRLQAGPAAPLIQAKE